MGIKKIKIQNFKRFRQLELDFDDGMNIIVGKNDAGKSSVLEAIHLAISGLLNGRYLRNELSQHLFNNDAVDEYLKSLKNGPPHPLPEILIELFLTADDCPELVGDLNSTKGKETGFFLKIHFDEGYQKDYEKLVSTKQIITLPIEYYTTTCKSFARDTLSPRFIPIKSALIDSSAPRYQNGSDVYISRIVRDFLDTQDVVGISQAYRKMKESFRNDPSIEAVNTKVQQAAHISEKAVSLSAELPAKSDWEDSLVTCVDGVPFQYIGKGEQNLIKTKLALHNKKAKNAAMILLEEPENHLTHAGLNGLLSHITKANADKQVIISTHSSFVANKLGLDRLILLNDGKTVRFTSLEPETQRFFQRIAGYDTLRIILARQVILVEGDSDELIVQKAYLVKNGKLPIEHGIDVISVGTSFLRFLAVADQINQRVAVVTDNDGDVDALKRKYKDYLCHKDKPHINICFDESVDDGDDIDGKPFNYNTLEPKLLKENGLERMNKILGTSFTTADDMHRHMRANKTDCALKIFDTGESIKFPKYILDALA